MVSTEMEGACVTLTRISVEMGSVTAGPVVTAGAASVGGAETSVLFLVGSMRPMLEVVREGSPAASATSIMVATVEIAVTSEPVDGHIAQTTAMVSSPPKVVVAATRPRPTVSGGSVRTHCA